MGHCGSFNLGPGLGVERANDTFNVDLAVVRGLHIFDNGLTLGAVVMFDYVDSSYRRRNTRGISCETGIVSRGLVYNISTRFSL